MNLRVCLKATVGCGLTYGTNKRKKWRKDEVDTIEFENAIYLTNALKSGFFEELKSGAEPAVKISVEPKRVVGPDGKIILVNELGQPILEGDSNIEPVQINASKVTDFACCEAGEIPVGAEVSAGGVEFVGTQEEIARVDAMIDNMIEKGELSVDEPEQPDEPAPSLSVEETPDHSHPAEGSSAAPAPESQESVSPLTVETPSAPIGVWKIFVKGTKTVIMSGIEKRSEAKLLIDELMAKPEYKGIKFDITRKETL